MPAPTVRAQHQIKTPGFLTCMYIHTMPARRAFALNDLSTWPVADLRRYMSLYRKDMFPAAGKMSKAELITRLEALRQHHHLDYVRPAARARVKRAVKALGAMGAEPAMAALAQAAAVGRVRPGYASLAASEFVSPSAIHNNPALAFARDDDDDPLIGQDVQLFTEDPESRARRLDALVEAWLRDEDVVAFPILQGRGGARTPALGYWPTRVQGSGVSTSTYGAAQRTALNARGGDWVDSLAGAFGIDRQGSFTGELGKALGRFI